MLLYIPEFFGVSLEVYLMIILIAVTSYYFWHWLTRKFIKDDKRRKVIIWVATPITTLMVYGGFMAVFLWFIFHEPSSSFDRDEWNKGAFNRYEMADDLIESNICVDQDSTQLKLLLGEPSWRNNKASRWTYRIGSGVGGLGFMDHNLLVDFKNDKVTVVTHQRLPN